MDAHGGIHVAIPGHAALATSPLAHVDPVTRVITPGLEPDQWGEFDVPLSLTIAGARHRTSILMTNGDLPGIPPEERLPGIVGVKLGGSSR